MKLVIDDGYFKDEEGRVVTLRGLNVGSKKPTQISSITDFFDPSTIR